ncbi:MAG: ATP-binding protein [Nocardioidaceae bacterium]
MAERRMCSILFADLVSFTPLAEGRDPEEVRELLGKYFVTARAIIARYGGTIEKFIGDAVMAVWGTPTALEGDTERAVRAGLELVEGVAGLAEELHIPGLAIRVGITTGDVAVNVGVVGEGMVAGDAVNTAARIQAACGPSEVWVNDATQRLAQPAIAFEDRGEHLLKGKAGPVRLWEATRVLSGVGGSQRIDGLEAPMLGRDAELRTVKELFHASVERRTPRLVLVTGPAGVGKSRLGWEFEKYVDGLSGTVLWHRGRCVSYGDGMAFWALAEIMRQRFGIAEEDPVPLAAEKLAAGLTEYVPDPAERAYVEERVARLLGVPSESHRAGSLGREELFAGWRLLLERLADQQPVALLVEDAQYADPGFLDFLDHLVDWARDVPIFILVFARPELTDAHPGFGTGRNRSTLALDPLDARSMARLLDALVPGMPDAGRDQLARRAQGNPLFAVETIRSLIDRDIVIPREGRYQLVEDLGSLDVPESLHGLLASRLDSLGPELRSLVAQGSVLGTSFNGDALVAISGRPRDEVERGLSDLVRREILTVVTDPLSPQRGDYGFGQELLRQVAYETLSRRDRKTQHQAVAAYLRGAFPNDGEEVSEVVAQHYIAALATVPDAPDAGQLREQAIDMLLRSAERSIRSGSGRSASSAYVRAAEFGATAAEADRERVAGWWEQAARCDLVTADNESAIAHARRAAEMLDALDQPRAAARSRATIGRALSRMGRHTEARETLRGAIDVLRTRLDVDTVSAVGWLVTLEAMAGSPEGDEVSLEALALAQAIDVDDGLLAGLFVTRGMALMVANRTHEALAAYQYGAELAERANDGTERGRALVNLADALSPTDPTRAAEAARAACDQTRRVGEQDELTFALGNLAVALVEIGDWDGARQVLEEQEESDSLAEAWYLRALRGVLAAMRGDSPKAMERADAMGPATEDPQDRAWAAALDAFLADADNRPQDALNHAREVLTQVDTVGIRHECIRWIWPLAARLASALGNTVVLEELLALLDGRPVGHLPPLLRAERDVARAKLLALEGSPDARARFAEAVAELRTVGNPYHLACGLIDYAALLVGSGRATEAAPLVTEAQEIADRLGCEPLRQRLTAAAQRQLA